MKRKRLKIADFKPYYNDIHHAYMFKRDKKSYELCLEPCMRGFCVALYVKGEEMKIVTPKVCTQEMGYDYDILGVGARHPKTWEHAITIANDMITNFFKK